MARFLCLIYFPPDAFDHFTPAEREAFEIANAAFDQSLIASGHYEGGSALALPRDAVTVRRRNGNYSSTDGPYAETKEHFGGYLMLKARDMAEVVELLSKDPMAAITTIEIRETKDVSDPDWDEWAAKAYGPR